MLKNSKEAQEIKDTERSQNEEQTIQHNYKENVTQENLTPIPLQAAPAKPLVPINDPNLLQPIFKYDIVGVSATIKDASLGYVKPRRDIIFTRRVPHFYALNVKFLDETGSQASFLPDNPYNVNAQSFFDYALSLYKGTPHTSRIPHTAYLSIKCDDPLYPFTVDPLEDSLMKNTSGKINEVDTMSITLSGSGVGMTYSSNNSLIELLSSLLYMMIGCIESYGREVFIGNDVSSKTTTYPEFEKTYSNYIGSEWLGTYEVDESEKEFFVGRLDVASVHVPQLGLASGYLPKIYPEYQHNLNFLSKVLQNETLRQLVDMAFERVRPYGSNQSYSVSDQNRKIRDSVVLNHDFVAWSLSNNYLSYILQYRVNVENFVDLCCSMTFSREDFEDVDQTYYYKFETYRVSNVMATDSLENYLIMPYTQESILSFDYARKFPPILVSELAHIFHLVKMLLSPIEFMTFGTSTQPAVDTATVTDNMSLPNIINMIAPLVSNTSPEIISNFVALDMMSHYLLLQISPVSYDGPLNSSCFGVDLLGLSIERLMFYNTYLRNKMAWIMKCCAFLQCYFPIEYGSTFINQGYGQAQDINGNRYKIKSLVGRSKQGFIPLMWAIEDNIPVVPTSLYDKVRQFLLLNNNDICMMKEVHSEYRIQMRKIRIPGMPYMCVQHDAMLPAAIHLSRVMTLMLSYQPRSTPDVKIVSRGHETMSSYLLNAIQSFSIWFHCIYCTVYLKVARSPILTISDDESVVPYDHVMTVGDRIRMVNPDFKYSVPNELGPMIVIPGVNSSNYGDYISTMMKGLLFGAWTPFGRYKGIALNKDMDMDYTRYQYIYSNQLVLEMIGEYVSQLQRRQKIVETEVLTGKLSYVDIDFDDRVKAPLTAGGLLDGVTSQAFARIRNLMDSEKYNAYGSQLFMKIGNLFTDPRVYSPVLQTIRPDMTRNVIGILGDRVIRPFVLHNFKLLVNRTFGDNGIKPLINGVTLSRVPINGDIEYLTRHRISPITVRLANSKYDFSLRDTNYVAGYIMTMSDGAREQDVLVTSIDDMRIALNNFTQFNANPYATIIYSDITVVTDAAQLIQEAVNDKILVVVKESIWCVPTFKTDINQLLNKPGPISYEIFDSVLSANKLSLMKVEIGNTSTTYRSAVITNVVRPIMAQSPIEPHTIFSNLHIISQASIDTHFIPLVNSTRTPLDDQMVTADNGTIVSMGRASTMSLQTSRLVYHYLPVRPVLAYATPLP